MSNEPIITYMATVTTVYRVHAKDKAHAVETIKDKVAGGVFHDNIVIVGQQGTLYKGSTTDEANWIEPIIIRLGNEQLG